MKTIALLDPHQGGHHDWYLFLFASVLRELGWQVVVLGPQAAAIAERLSDAHVHAVSWSPPADALRTRVWRGRKKLWDSAHAAVMEAERNLRVTIDVSFFAWMDSWLGRGQRRGSVARAFPRPFTGLVFQPWMYRLRGRAPAMRRAMLDPCEPLHARSCAGVAVLDAKIAPMFAARLKRPVVSFPDVPSLELDGRAQLAAKLTALAAGRSVVLLTGVIDGRKDVGAFLRAAATAESTEWFFACAGPVAWQSLSSDEQCLLSALDEKPTVNAAILATENLPEPVINALISRANLLWLAYRNFPFSSNLLSKAAAFRVPVCSNGEHLIGEVTREFSLGIIAADDASRCALFTANGRARLAAHAASPAFLEGAARFARRNSRAVLTSAFSSVLAAGETTRQGGRS